MKNRKDIDFYLKNSRGAERAAKILEKYRFSKSDTFSDSKIEKWHNPESPPPLKSIPDQNLSGCRKLQHHIESFYSIKKNSRWIEYCLALELPPPSKAHPELTRSGRTSDQAHGVSLLMAVELKKEVEAAEG